MAFVMPEFYFMYIFSVFVIAFALALCSVIPVKKTAISLGALDIPKDYRRMHRETVVRGGGLSVFFAFSAASLFALSEYGNGFSDLSGALLSGSALIVGVGLCDDVSQMSAKTKLLSQLTVSFIPIAFSIGIDASSLFGEKTVFARLFSSVLTLFLTVSLINALNFIDGLDGLAAGFSLIASFSLFLCNTFSRNYECSLLCVALCGSALGFLPYNKYRAKIFMGDCGSLFFGYALATLGVATYQGGVRLSSKGAFLSALPFFLIFAYPLSDLAFAVIRRLYNRQSIFSSDAKHFHHRLIKKGLSHPQSVALLLSAATLFCSLGVALYIFLC